MQASLKSTLGLSFAVCVGVGIAMGAAFGNPGIGVCVGAAVGLIFGKKLS